MARTILAIFLGVAAAVSFVGALVTVFRPDEVSTLPSDPQIYSAAVPAQPETTEFTVYQVPLDPSLQWYISKECELRGIPETLVLALIWRESRYQADAISKTQDYGLMQINICNHADVERILNVTDILNPYQNCKAGIWILDSALDSASGDLNMAVMAYKAPNGAKDLWKQGIYSTEYSRSVISKMQELEAQR